MEKSKQEEEIGLIEGLNKWREKHPKGTMREIEEEVDKRLSVMRARMIADTAMKSGRAEWEAGEKEAVCPKCGGELLKKRKLETWEGQEIELEREYGICLNCGHGIFPPR